MSDTLVCMICGPIADWYLAYSKALGRDVHVCARCTPRASVNPPAVDAPGRLEALPVPALGADGDSSAALVEPDAGSAATGAAPRAENSRVHETHYTRTGVRNDQT